MSSYILEMASWLIAIHLVANMLFILTSTTVYKTYTERKKEWNNDVQGT